MHKAREMPKEQFRREVEKELTGRETEPWEIIYFKLYKNQIPVIEQALETAALMLGSDKSRGYCLEMHLWSPTRNSQARGTRKRDSRSQLAQIVVALLLGIVLDFVIGPVTTIVLLGIHNHRTAGTACSPLESLESLSMPRSLILSRLPGRCRLSNEREWLDACRGSKVKPGGNFEFSGMVTETLLLGNVAARAGQKLGWDRVNLKITNSDLAQKFVRPERRSGWEL